MSQPQLKVTYFPMAGRAELTRLALAFGEITFDDERIAGPQFAERKPSLPLGQLPVLEVNSVTYPQSMAMARYAARLSGLYPQNALEALKVDSIVETLLDVLNVYIDIKFRTKDEEAKAEKSKKFLDESLPKTLAYLETRVQGKFFLGEETTLADIHLFDLVRNGLTPTFPEFSISGYPKLAAVLTHVEAIPSINAYLKK